MTAIVDVMKVKFLKSKELGIDFSNEIDAWAKMEIKHRQQISHLRQYGHLKKNVMWKDARSLKYSVREKLD